MRTIQFRAKVKKTRAENSFGKKPDDGTWLQATCIITIQATRTFIMT